ncbi:MAG: hypothetical protein ACK5ND_12840 [Bacteroides sp.]
MKDVDQAFPISDIFSRVVLEGTCKSDKNFSITALKRSGRTGISSYGAIDDLTLSYQGNH